MTFDIDWNAARPDQAGFDAGWSKTEIVALETLPALVAVARALAGTHVNGGARVAQFRFVAADNAVRWVMSRNRFAEFDFFAHFLTHPVVLAAVPEADQPVGLSAAFRMEETFSAFGRLSGCLAQGGAYKRFAGTDDEVRDLTTRFMRAVVSSRAADCYAWISHQPWSPWFHDVAWDATFFWFDRADGTATLLLSTDTD